MKNDIQYYEESKTYCGLTQPQQKKAQLFLKNIEYDADNKHFICKPIKGYNVRTRTFKRSKELGFLCSCQGFQSKLKKYRIDPEAPAPYCSHIGALKLWFIERNKAHKWGPFKEVIQCV